MLGLSLPLGKDNVVVPQRDQINLQLQIRSFEPRGAQAAGLLKERALAFQQVLQTAVSYGVNAETKAFYRMLIIPIQTTVNKVN